MTMGGAAHLLQDCVWVVVGCGWRWVAVSWGAAEQTEVRLLPLEGLARRGQAGRGLAEKQRLARGCTSGY